MCRNSAPSLHGAGADLLEQLREQLLTRLAARLDPRDRQILELAHALARERRLPTPAGPLRNSDWICLRNSSSNLSSA